MKKTLLAIGILAISTNAFAAHSTTDQAEVVSVSPVYTNVIRHQQVPVTRTVCENTGRRDSGLIEKGVSGMFGSTDGLIGTAIGVAIGEHVGGGRGNDAAKIIGGIWGNKLGNNRASRRSNTCYEVESAHSQERWVKEVTSYSVTVDLNGSLYNVERRSEPRIGSYINVAVSVN